MQMDPKSRFFFFFWGGGGWVVEFSSKYHLIRSTVGVSRKIWVVEQFGEVQLYTSNAAHPLPLPSHLIQSHTRSQFLLLHYESLARKQC